MENNSDKGKKTKILIIEDEQSLVDLLVAKLTKEGYEVQYAYDGEEGLNKAKDLFEDLQVEFQKLKMALSNPPNHPGNLEAAKSDAP